MVFVKVVDRFNQTQTQMNNSFGNINKKENLTATKKWESEKSNVFRFRW